MKRTEALEIAKPILFNTEMVKAIQNGTKAVTRRVVKPKYTNTKIILKNGIPFETVGTPATMVEIKSPYEVGDILYVRETWFKVKVKKPNGNAVPSDFKRIIYYYRADGEIANSDCSDFKWRPSIHMPKEAARIFLQVKSRRAEHLQNISDEDMLRDFNICPEAVTVLGKNVFGKPIWDSTIKNEDLDKYGWNANPLVWVYKFERIKVEV